MRARVQTLFDRVFPHEAPRLAVLLHERVVARRRWRHTRSRHGLDAILAPECDDVYHWNQV